jgi:predicted HAD superfamily Cof-like phosphohydrolase
MSQHVREFNLAAQQPCPDIPEVMSRDQIAFLSKMILDEVMELWATVMGPEETKSTLITMITDAKPLEKLEYTDPVDQIADQADALVDIQYYMHNAACKHGINLDPVFDAVHAANMAKRDASGVFQRRVDGKIIKPSGWQPPNIRAEILAQIQFGSWNHTTSCKPTPDL